MTCKNLIISLFCCTVFVLSACGGSGGGSTFSPSPVVIPDLNSISISGITTDAGNFDPAPTTDGIDIWMSYSHVSVDASGIKEIDTRIAQTSDAGLSWTDAGLVNESVALALDPPADVNRISHEVSRLVYNPYAVAQGADPWLMLWHRYLTVRIGGVDERLFEHGWIGMKSGASPTTLGTERKLFTGNVYDSVNDATLGSPEYALNMLYATELGDCATFTEPGLLPKAAGIYVSLYCAKATPPGKIILLRCDHHMNNCVYLGDMITGDEAANLEPSYDGFSASELVSSNGNDYLIVTPTETDIYRGCVAYEITDLENAAIERSAGKPVASLIIEENGDFNGACGYIPELTGSGIMISEAFFTGSPVFQLFTTGADL